LGFYGKWAYLRGKKGILSYLKSCEKSSIIAELKAMGGVTGTAFWAWKAR